MNLGSWINQAKDLGYSALAKTSEAVGAGVGFVQSTVGGWSLLGSTESSASYEDGPVDEKHYFLIPDRRCEEGYSLYAMRCLPDGAPPINDLPKRRVLHLPNEHATPTVEHLVLAQAREAVEAEPAHGVSLGGRLNELADQIDQLDGKVFNGVLLIGGLVALINPLAGAAVAMKAMLPSVGLLLSKYGLKHAGDTADSYALASRLKRAEKEVLAQFRGADTQSVVNPILAQVDRALETTQEQYDPVFDVDATSIAFGPRDRDRLRKLTCQAVTNTYADALGDQSSWRAACLGPEDIRFLRLLRDLAKGEAQ